MRFFNFCQIKMQTNGNNSTFAEKNYTDLDFLDL
jgi:hypothetical protein